MDVIGFKEHAPPPAPTSIGVYDKDSKKQKKTCTLEMRVYRPGYIIDGISLSTETRRRSQGKLTHIKELLETKFEATVLDYLKPLRDLHEILLRHDLSFLPKVGSKYKEWEVRTLLEHTIIDERGDITEMGKKVVEACKSASDPYLEFERLCLLKGIADRMEGLTEILNNLSNSGSIDIFNMSESSKSESYDVVLLKPIINNFYLVNVEETPALYSFPSINSVVLLSNLSISEYYRFHYSLRKEIYKIYMHQKKATLEPGKVHKFAIKMRTIDLLKNLEVYKMEEGYRFLRFPTNLLRTLARYSLSKMAKASFDRFLLDLKEDFRIIVHPEDLKKIYPFTLASYDIEAFYEFNFSMFLDRLIHAGIAEVEPDGEVVLVVR